MMKKFPNPSNGHLNDVQCPYWKFYNGQHDHKLRRKHGYPFEEELEHDRKLIASTLDNSPVGVNNNGLGWSNKKIKSLLLYCKGGHTYKQLAVNIEQFKAYKVDCPGLIKLLKPSKSHCLATC